MTKIPVAVIAGPTGVGKTALSVKIAKLIDAEIVSADSMQIYKGMDVGTAKVTKQEMDGVAHHLIDIVTPFEKFSVCDYKDLCKKTVLDIFSRGKTPLLVGGTGLYIDSFLKDIDYTDTVVDNEYREYLENIALEKGNEYLHSMLCKVDEKSGKTIHPNNVKRVIRALEFYKSSGFPISEHNENSKQKPSPYDCKYICFTRDREQLYKRIDARVDIMLENGLVNETKSLLDMGLTDDSTAMQAIGYKEIIPYINGLISFEDAVENLKRSSRRYAKRQLTWFGNRDDIIYVNLDNYDNIDECAKECAQIIKDNIK